MKNKKNIGLSIARDQEIVKELLGRDLCLIIGTDEAGRGPLAGPLVVVGVCFGKDGDIPEVFDSKKLTAKKREELAPLIKEKALAYHIEIISLDDIKKLNIYQASKWGMIRVCQEIQKKLSCSVLLTDAMKISPVELPHTEVISIVKGDQKSFHIAAASILAKTERDKIMKDLHKEYPNYQWDRNKGYPTKAHREALIQYGVSPYHRKGFKLFP